MPAPNRETITVYQGQTLAKAFQLVNEDNSPFDLTAFTARMQVREQIDASTLIASTTAVAPEIEIELGGGTGLLTVKMTAVATAALPTYNQPQSWVYDLELVDSNQTPVYVERVLEGSFNVLPEVTRG